MNPTLPSKREFELKCKEFEKSGLRWTACLEEAAKFFGFSNYRHYRNVLKETFIRATAVLESKV